MTISKKVIKQAKENKGIITSSMIDEMNIARSYLKMLVEDERLEKRVRGVYALKEAYCDSFFTLQNRFKKGVYSNRTALFLHELISVAPIEQTMTFPNNYNLTNVKANNIDAKRASDLYYNLGIYETKSPNGQIIKVYNKEKTLCDILRPRSGVELSLIKEAFINYLEIDNKNITKLIEYSKILKVESKVKMYLELFDNE